MRIFRRNWGGGEIIQADRDRILAVDCIDETLDQANFNRIIVVYWIVSSVGFALSGT